MRVIDAQGEMIGVLSRKAALEAAQEAGLDLIEVSPNATPPVCKILDYGKYKYEQQKKANEAKKKQKGVELKELKLRPTIEENDYQVKLRKAKEFLADGNKVKFTVRFRGREVAHQDVGIQVLNRYKEDLAEISKVDFQPKLEGRQMMMILSALAT